MTYRTGTTKTKLSSSSLIEVLIGCCVITFTFISVRNVRSTNAVGEVFDRGKGRLEHDAYEADKEEAA